MTNRMKALLLIQVVSLAAILSTATVHAETGYGGTIHYRDGTSVVFEWLGGLDGPRGYFVDGKIGVRNATVELHELREVIFSEPSKHYAPGEARVGSMIVVNQAGERFTITGSIVSAQLGFAGVLRYVYQDAITNTLRQTDDSVRDTIASITIGEHVGNMKRNPETSEFFPPTFVYDPYTGHRLEWATP